MKTTIKKLLMISAAIASMAGTAYAYNVQVVNHTQNPMRVSCTGGECAALKSLNDSVTQKTSTSSTAVANVFEATVSVVSDLGQCNYKMRANEDRLLIDRIGFCSGAFDGNVHDEATLEQGVASIVLTSK